MRRGPCRMCHSKINVIAADEMLLRRFEPMWCRSPKNQGKPLATSFFKPKPADVDGLSVSRSSFSTFEVACKTAKGKEWALAQFAVRLVLDLGMTVLSKPIKNGDQGHAIIPELNHNRMQSSKEEENTVIELASAIADASEVVWQPTIEG